MTIKTQALEAIRGDINRAASRYVTLASKVNARNSDLVGLMMMRLHLWEAARLMPKAAWEDYLELRDEMLNSPTFHPSNSATGAIY